MSSGDTTTHIDLIVGFDHKTPPLRIVRDAGFAYRTGVIQHTYRPDSVDAYFDEALWRRLLEFAGTFGVASIINRPWSGPKAPSRDWHSGKAKQPMVTDACSVEEFLERWDGECPPELILAWDNRKLLLSIATEYWNQAGGPRPYADSFTYSVCSGEELSARIVDFLRASPDAAGWTISPEVLLAIDDFD